MPPHQRRLDDPPARTSPQYITDDAVPGDMGASQTVEMPSSPSAVGSRTLISQRVEAGPPRRPRRAPRPPLAQRDYTTHVNPPKNAPVRLGRGTLERYRLRRCAAGWRATAYIRFQIQKAGSKAEQAWRRCRVDVLLL